MGLQRSPDEPGIAAPDSPTKEKGMEKKRWRAVCEQLSKTE